MELMICVGRMGSSKLPGYEVVVGKLVDSILIERGVLLPAVKRAFPVIAYYPDGSTIQQGRVLLEIYPSLLRMRRRRAYIYGGTYGIVTIAFRVSKRRNMELIPKESAYLSGCHHF